jgi:hypothetical protein
MVINFLNPSLSVKYGFLCFNFFYINLTHFSMISFNNEIKIINININTGQIIMWNIDRA